ncbi:hypothetical protein AVEN_267343-1 [Araneus ventricosus]|uniref:Uncharacterized protein n=1 Tax=Araneus ventricosus TaxID=182803 RepID=A0A4Y2DL89_ARAVE|nr:hypothetical protein AVEN_267343-1 [Araneus ventricosus]
MCYQPFPYRPTVVPEKFLPFNAGWYNCCTRHNHRRSGQPRSAVYMDNFEDLVVGDPSDSFSDLEEMLLENMVFEDHSDSFNDLEEMLLENMVFEDLFNDLEDLL